MGSSKHPSEHIDYSMGGKGRPTEHYSRHTYRLTTIPLIRYPLTRIVVRGLPDAKINYDSSENRALLQQRDHKSPVLLMIDQSSGESEIQGRFQVLTHCHDNPDHPSVDSVLLGRVSD